MASPANPNALDHFRVGEPTRFLGGKVSSNTLDYFRVGEPFGGITVYVQSGSAALTGTGTLSASGTVTRLGSASLTGNGTLAASGTVTRLGTVSLTGLGSLLVVDGIVIHVSRGNPVTHTTEYYGYYHV